MATSRFKIVCKVDGGAEKEATVEINRDNFLFTVRPKFSRVTYTLPLSSVAELVVWNVSRADANLAKKIG